MVRAFSDKFLFAETMVSDDLYFCSSSASAFDDLSDIADMVGSGEKLDGDHSQPSDDFSFDLESELTRAMDGPSTPSVSAPIAPVEVNAPVEFEMEALEKAVGVHDGDAVPNMEFGDLIAAEFDKALAEETARTGLVESVPQATPVSVAEAPAFTDPVVDLGLAPLPPQPVQAPPIQTAPLAMPVFEPALTETPAMDNRDYSDPAADFQPFAPEVTQAAPQALPEAVQLSVPEAAQPENFPSIDPIDAVLGASAALGAAAVAPRVVEPSVEQQHESDLESIDFEMPNLVGEDRIEIPPASVIAAQSSGGAGGRKVAVAVLAVALLGGTAALAWNSFTEPSGEAPTILADSTPVKVKPKDAGGKVVPNQDAKVYEKVAGAKPLKKAQKVLKNATEKPVEMAKVKPSVKKVATQEGESLVLAPRAVRTVVVKPDGTIVTEGAAPKLAKAPAKPKNETTGGVKFKVPSANDASAPKQVAKLEPAKPVKVKAVAVKPVKVAPKPVAKKAVVKKKAAPVAKAKPVALPSVKSPYAVQISSRRSPEAAKSAWKKLVRRYGSVLRKFNPDIREKNITGKGKFYQVRVPAQTKQAAANICSRLKRAGGDCFVTR